VQALAAVRKEKLMPAEPTYVIVGASMAGAKAAETLREEGFGGSIVLLGEEQERPYERPPLSKGYLLGKEERSSIYVHEPAWYGENDVDLRLGVTATSLDAGSREVGLADGGTVRYDRLLLATGAAPRRLSVPGADLEGAMYLRRVGDSERLGEALRGGGRVVIVGAGWIGLEVSAAAREFGCEVTVVEPEPGALHRHLGPELGDVFRSLHEEHGVTFRFGESVTELRGSGGKVASVSTSAGVELGADLVIVAIGAVPATRLAADAGLDVANGVIADAGLRTSAHEVFAAGDVANAFHPLYGKHVRVEHWANALNGGPAAARSMLGKGVSYDAVPYFFTDQYDLGMEYSGFVEPGSYDQIVYRGDREAREFIAFWLSGGVVVAGMNVNVWDVNDDIQSLIRARRPVSESRLADPDTPLPTL
jgi:NADPH-dependent 2,4-dienoyl-CoA reductase/sulfur reductase-like enzyme